jgi:hypothetical protein
MRIGWFAPLPASMASYHWLGLNNFKGFLAVHNFAAFLAIDALFLAAANNDF